MQKSVRNDEIVTRTTGDDFEEGFDLGKFKRVHLHVIGFNAFTLFCIYFTLYIFMSNAGKVIIYLDIFRKGYVGVFLVFFIFILLKVSWFFEAISFFC